MLCWGRNHAGQLGRGTATLALAAAERQPARVLNLSDAVAVALGDEHACARRRGGTVVCWGSNAEGQLGDGALANRAVPAPVHGIGDAVELAAGAYHTCARRQDGSVWCWGNNQRGQLGIVETIQPSNLGSGHHRTPAKVEFLAAKTLRAMGAKPLPPP